MNWDAISAVAETIVVIAVVASLAYVARQIGQNTAMMRAESRNVMLHGAQQELFTIVENPAIWREFSDEELDDDNVRLLMWLIASLRAREHEWFQYQHGALDEASWRSYALAIPIVLATERMRGCWDAVKSQFDPDFARVVDELLDNEELNKTHKKQATALRKALAS